MQEQEIGFLEVLVEMEVDQDANQNPHCFLKNYFAALSKFRCSKN
jgi:hypothetical protein